jgi:hypothetical protein
MARPKRRELEEALLTLETTPLLLQKLAASRTSDDARPLALELSRMAGRESELWGRFIEQIVRPGTTPIVPLEDAGADLAAAVNRFAAARRRNLRRLRRVPGAAWSQTARLEDGRTLSVSELPAAMADADRKSLAEITRLGTLPRRRDSRDQIPFTEPSPEPALR